MSRTWSISRTLKTCCIVSASTALMGWSHGGLIQHLDATVAGSVVTDESGVVTQWFDQSGSGNNATDLPIIGAPTYPSANPSGTGLQGVDMGDSRNGFRLFDAGEQDGFLDFTGAASGNSGFAVLVAFRADSILGGNVRDTVFVNHGNAATANSFGLKYQGGTPQFFALGTSTLHTGAAVSAGDSVVLGFNYNASTGDYEFFSSTDGTTDTGTIAASGNFSSTQPLYLGTSENSGQFMDGMVGEVQVYNMVLSSSEFATKAEQLVGKWVPEPATTTLLAMAAVFCATCRAVRHSTTKGQKRSPSTDD